MFKGGGTAGGGKKGPSITSMKQMPKFIEQIKMQVAQKERESTIGDKTFTNEFKYDPGETYDIDNAQVEGNEQIHIKDKQQSIERKYFSKPKQNQSETNQQQEQQADKIQLQNFKPQFKSKSKGDDTKLVKEKIQQSEVEKPQNNKNDIGKRKAINDYIHVYNEEQQKKKQAEASRKKVKSNLLSFEQL